MRTNANNHACTSLHQHKQASTENPEIHGHSKMAEWLSVEEEKEQNDERMRTTRET